MGKVSKSTKRFSKNHLSNEIKTRKLRQKIKFREKKTWGSRKAPEELEAQGKLKKATRSDKNDEAEEDEEETAEAEPVDDDNDDKGVDEFLEKGFFEALEADDDADDNEETEVVEKSSVPDSKQHKRDLERLKEEQPEFYKYLAENDAGLLEFDDEDDDEEVSEGEKAQKSKKGAKPDEVEDEESEKVSSIYRYLV
jgi:nucleolar complex protein 2